MFCEGINFFLEEGFAARQLHEGHPCWRSIGAPVERLHTFQDVFGAHLLTAMKSVSRVAPGAAQVAAGEAHEDARKARASSFALNGFEYFRDVHRTPRTL